MLSNTWYITYALHNNENRSPEQLFHLAFYAYKLIYYAAVNVYISAWLCIYIYICPDLLKFTEAGNCNHKSLHRSHNYREVIIEQLTCGICILSIFYIVQVPQDSSL